MHGPKCGIYLGFGIIGVLLAPVIVGGAGAFLMTYAILGSLTFLGAIATFGLGVLLLASAITVLYLAYKI
jgi:hypothetical protein